MIDKFLEKLKEAGYTQSDIAERCGVNRVTIADYHSGKCKPSIDVVIKLADAFGVSTDVVLGRAEANISKNDKKRWERKKGNCVASNLVI